MSEPVHIVFAADDGYTAPLAVSIVSLLKHARRKGEIIIYVMDGGISELNRARIKALESVRAHSEVRFVPVDDRDFEGFPLFAECYTIATYYRLKLPSLLPDVERVIYLDSDIAVELDIRDMWDYPMDGMPLMVVEEPRILNEDRLVMLDIAAESPYFNGGVLVMDLAWMRREKMEDVFAKYIVKHKEHLRYQDQDVLNGCFIGLWKAMPPRFNMMFYMVEEAREDNFLLYSVADIRQSRRLPGLIHFNHHPKPWNFGAIDPRRRRYFKYLKITGFPIIKAKRKSWRHYYYYFREVIRNFTSNKTPRLHAFIRKLLRVYRFFRYPQWA